MASAFRDRVTQICKALPGAEKSDPWGGGHDAWKVGGKMFACIGAVQPGIAVKCADVETATMLIEAGIGVKAPYFHASWLLLPVDAAPEDLHHRITASYDLIRAKLPKRLRMTWPERGA